MEVKKPDTEHKKPWWAGKTLTCAKCKTEVTLVFGDHPIAYNQEVQEGGETVTYPCVTVPCPTCSEILKLRGEKI